MFVYGTLRPGQTNYGLVRSAVIARTLARLDNHSLRADACASYPYAVEDRGHSVVGDLLELKPGTEEAVLRRLDALEGYRPDATDPEKSHYLRVRRTVTTTSGDDDRGAAGPVIEAWVYLAGPAVSPGQQPLVPSGDWTVRRASLPGRL